MNKKKKPTNNKIVPKKSAKGKVMGKPHKSALSSVFHEPIVRAFRLSFSNMWRNKFLTLKY